MKKPLALLFICFLPFLIGAQTTVYSEDFTSQVNKGIIGPSTYDTSGVSWYIDYSSASLTNTDDYLKVNANDSLTANDLNGIAKWYSEKVSISALTAVNIRADIRAIGNMEPSDILQLYYQIDNGSETLFETNGNNSDNFGALVAAQDSVYGDSIQIIVYFNCNVNGEIFYLDNVEITENIGNPTSINAIPTATGIDISWVNPATYDEVLIVANTGTAISSGSPLGDGTAYTANTTIGSGTALLGGNVVYKGAGTSVSLTGLTAANTLYFKVFTRKGTTWSSGYNASIYYNTPNVGDIYITEYGRNSNYEKAYLELYNTTANEVSLAGCKIVIFNSSSVLDTVIDLSYDISGSITVPANGFLILNRNSAQSTFETTWGVDLSSTGYPVNYNRTGVTKIGTNNYYQLKFGGTQNTDDGTLIDETTELASSTSNRIFQIPIGHWNNNEESNSNANPGSFVNHDNITNLNFVYADGGWLTATGLAYSQPTSATGSLNALVLRGNATIPNGSDLNTLVIRSNASADLSTESVSLANLVLQHDASLVITSSGSVTVSGNIQIERDGHNQNTDFNLWGTPLTTLNSFATIFPNANECDIYAFEATTQTWKHDEVVNSSYNCLGNTGTYDAAVIISASEATPDGNLDVARGYFVPGNSSNTISFAASGGTLNNGTITANVYGASTTTVDGSNDWNILANPYPSAISATDFLTTNSGLLNNVVYLYLPGNGISAASFSAYNTSDNVHIASCQGFYVDATSSTDGLLGTVSFTNSMRTNQNSSFRSASSNFSGVYLRAFSDSITSDYTRLYFSENGLVGFDKQFDAFKMLNGGLNFASYLDSTLMVFNGFPEIDTNSHIIPLYLDVKTSNVYTIEIDSLIGSFNTHEIWLEDTQTGIFTNLKNQSYSFNSPQKVWKNRFFLHLQYTPTVNSISNPITHSVQVYAHANNLFYQSSHSPLAQIRLFDATGKLLCVKPLSEYSGSFSLPPLNTGVYIVESTLLNGETLKDKVVLE